MSKVLVTGATGFIGKRLLYKLLEEGHEVFALSKIKGIKFPFSGHPHFHVIEGDLRDLRIGQISEEIEAAYYLVHSMGRSVDDLVKEEKKIASNFLTAVNRTNCRQIIYLGGIIENEAFLSPHLQSRLAVEEVLKSGHIPCTILRSSIIIGSGGASFEIISDLVEKLPFMIAPKWVKSICQPIAVSDVLFYLSKVLLNPSCLNKTYDIGGPEAMSFKELLLRLASFRKLKRIIIDVPVLTPKLSSYWLVLITSVSYSICAHLIESMRQNTRKLNLKIDQDLPHKCLSYEEAIARAFEKIKQNEVVSTWMDAWELTTLNADVQNFVEVPKERCFKDTQTADLKIPIEEIQRRLWSIGGEKGWYSMNWAWKLRGLIDKLVGGPGLNRGRRHPSEMAVGDSIDFWRVLLADQKNRHLILYAEMRLPGEAWLEFEILEEKKVLRQTATFRPRGLLGRLYWYVLLPFHHLIFKNMAKNLAA